MKEGVIAKCPQCKTKNAPGYEVNETFVRLLNRKKSESSSKIWKTKE